MTEAPYLVLRTPGSWMHESYCDDEDERPYEDDPGPMPDDTPPPGGGYFDPWAEEWSGFSFGPYPNVLHLARHGIDVADARDWEPLRLAGAATRSCLERGVTVETAKRFVDAGCIPAHVGAVAEACGTVEVAESFLAVGVRWPDVAAVAATGISPAAAAAWLDLGVGAFFIPDMVAAGITHDACAAFLAVGVPYVRVPAVAAEGMTAADAAPWAAAGVLADAFVGNRIVELTEVGVTADTVAAWSRRLGRTAAWAELVGYLRSCHDLGVTTAQVAAAIDAGLVLPVTSADYGNLTAVVADLDQARTLPV